MIFQTKNKDLFVCKHNNFTILLFVLLGVPLPLSVGRVGLLRAPLTLRQSLQPCRPAHQGSAALRAPFASLTQHTLKPGHSLNPAKLPYTLKMALLLL
jgi:hypothetical protein